MPPPSTHAMGAKNNRAKQLKEARDRKKRKLDSAIDPTRPAHTERQASEEACTLEIGTDENGCEDMLDTEWEDIFEEEDSESPSEDDNTDEEDWDMLYGKQKKSTGWKELQRNMQTSARKVSEARRYIGNSERTRFRKNAAFRDAAEGCLPLTRLGFSPLSTIQDAESDSDSVIDSEINDIQGSLVSMVDEIGRYVSDRTKDGLLSKSGQENLEAVQQYLRLRIRGTLKYSAAKQIAVVRGRKVGYYKRIIAWSRHWERHKEYVESSRGKHPKTKNLLVEYGLYDVLRDWISKTKQRYEINPTKLRYYINKNVLPELGVDRKIALTTARRWLYALGWLRSEVDKGLYYDGHERKDVLEYRTEFLRRMEEYERRMIRGNQDNQEGLFYPDLNEGECHLVFYTHDECIFYCNDGQKVIWHPDGCLPLRKKGQGGSVMVSEYLSEVDGPLSYVDENNNITRARVTILPGKDRDGYWRAEDVAAQFEKAIAIHKRKHPDKDGLWAFDNSSNHNSYAHDALLVSRMNLQPGGKQGRLRDTVVDGRLQQMNFPVDYPDPNLAGKPKGMAQVLRERGLWREGLLKKCRLCTTGEVVEGDPVRTECCAQRILELQPDFRAQRSRLEEIAEREGQHIIFYPKFHCELNFIEMYWGSSKRYTRNNCNYTWGGLQKTVPLALESVELVAIRRFARKAFRYMDAYRKGLTMEQATYAVKKFRSHRRIPEDYHNIEVA